MISYRFIGNLRVNVLGGYLDSMEQDKTFLGTEPIGKLLMKLAVPTVIAQLVNMLYNIIDRVYIGHIPVSYTHLVTGWAAHPGCGSRGFDTDVPENLHAPVS